MTGPAHLNSVPKVMMPVYEKIAGLTNEFCDRHLNSEYRQLARAMTATLCSKRQSSLTSGQPRTLACGIIYVLGRINFLGDPSFSPHMTTAELCAAFEVGESTVHAKARAIEKAVGTKPFDPQWTLPSLVDKSAGVDGRGEWPDGRFAEHAPRSPGSCLQRRIDSLHPGGSQRSVLTAMVIQGSISAVFARS